MIVSVGLSMVGGTYVYYAALIYTALAIAYFMVKPTIKVDVMTIIGDHFPLSLMLPPVPPSPVHRFRAYG